MMMKEKYQEPMTKGNSCLPACNFPATDTNFLTVVVCSHSAPSQRAFK